MKEDILYMSAITAAGFAVNYSLRALPFALFAGRGRELPKAVERFGAIVSPVVIAALIAYSYAGLEWKTLWPYLAGALVVGLQLWKRNPLVSIVAGTILYMCLLNCGCVSAREIELDAARPSIRYSPQGFLVGERFVDPKNIPALLESYEVPHDCTIHILIDDDAAANLRPARVFMGMLAKAGYTRSVLVTKKRAESTVAGGDGR